MIAARVLLFTLGAAELLFGLVLGLSRVLVAMTPEAGGLPAGPVAAGVSTVLFVGLGLLLILFGSIGGLRTPWVLRPTVWATSGLATLYLANAVLMGSPAPALVALPFAAATVLLQVKSARRYYMSGR
ncbi:hypothetical protein [Streptomonospora litoralis]|uniref:hypothetical protein n=1 Tax=Streptomonospora litoralis TaxID=2498135 RepID=UPI001036A2DD|nr:hypothetical protein [Streptomonospora litoralis]